MGWGTSWSRRSSRATGFEDFLAAQSDLSPKAWPRWVHITRDLPTATNKILKRELILQGVGGVAAGPGAGGAWWEREERGTAYTELAVARV